MPTTYTPLRYPGGKSQLYRFIENILVINEITDGVYVEPFSGGAGIAVQLLQKNKVEAIVINDFDPSIHAIWYAILNRTEDFIKLIEATDITMDEWKNQKAIYEEVHFDPPYFVKGQSLYTNFFTEEKHQALHDEIVKLKDHYWITTYDHSQQIADIYSDTEIYEYELNYSAQKKRVEQEYLFTNKVTQVKTFANVRLKVTDAFKNVG